VAPCSLQRSIGLVKKPFDPKKINQIVGTVDRLIRFTIGFVILIIAYILNFSILHFAELHAITIYLWVSALTGWDPFYAISNQILKFYRTSAAINGRFKI